MGSGLKNQRGMGMTGVILTIAAALFVVIMAMKIVPTYLQNMTIQKIFKTIATDPEMQAASVKDIRDSFNKRAMMDNISTLTAEAIEISKEGTTWTLSAAYAVKVPVAGNMSLLIEFTPSSAK